MTRVLVTGAAGFIGSHLCHSLLADGVEPVDEVHGVGNAFLDISTHVLVRIEFRFLRQVTDVDSGLRPGLTVKLGIEPGHDAQHRGLAGSIEPENTDLGAREER